MNGFLGKKIGQQPEMTHEQVKLLMERSIRRIRALALEFSEFQT